MLPLTETMPNLSLNPEIDLVLAIAAPTTNAGFPGSSTRRSSDAEIASSKTGFMSTPASTDGTTPKAVSAENLPPTFGLARNTL